jgi:hypothetical protein
MKLNAQQLDTALAVKIGDYVTLRRLWNQTAPRGSRRMAEKVRVDGIEKGPGSQTCLRFLIDGAGYLDAAWFAFEEKQAEMKL